MSHANSDLQIPATMPQPGRVVRPWGSFAQYAHNQPVTVSLMEVRPHERLSLQSHHDRAELWIALDDGARVEIGDAITDAVAGQEFWIPRNAPHRLANPRDDRVVRVLEVAFGDWRQDDIVRYEDDYHRPEVGE